MTHQGKGISRTVIRWLIKEGNLKNYYKVEASSQEVSNTSRTRRSTIYYSSRKTTKQEEKPFHIKEPSRRSSQKGTYIKLNHLQGKKNYKSSHHSPRKSRHQASLFEERNLKSIKIQQGKPSILQEEIKSTTSQTLWSKYICPLMNICQFLFARKVTNLLGPLTSLHGRRGLICFSKRMNF